MIYDATMPSSVTVYFDAIRILSKICWIGAMKEGNDLSDPT